MSLEGFNLQRRYNSLESLKASFKEKLNVILDKQLTVENIETFADKALDEIVKLTDQILFEYKNNSNIHTKVIPINKQEQENEAFAFFDLPNIQEILQSIILAKEEIDSLMIFSENIKVVDRVITPPQKNYFINTEQQNGNFKNKEIFPRFLTLLYILKHDFGILPRKENMKEGIVTSGMMREIPYLRVEVPELNRTAYICEEEGNVSYIFDTEKIKEKGITLDELDMDNKGEKNSLIVDYPGIGVRIIQSKNWRISVANALGEEIPEKKIENTEQSGKREQKAVSEFVVKLSFEAFRDEVCSLYPGKGGISDWYRKERKRHSNWPANPDIQYKDSGWVGLPELVGKENRFKKEILSLKALKFEVRAIYKKELNPNAFEWYREESKKHPKWTPSPNKVFANKGWNGWSDLVGVENYKKKVYVTWKDFQIEVSSLYPGECGVGGWYREEQKKHPSWPTHPERIYKNKGWAGWPELVGKENHYKKG